MKDASPSKPRKAGGPVVPHELDWKGRLAVRTGCLFARLLNATIRYELQDPHGSMAYAQSNQIIGATWHNRLSVCLMVYHRFIAMGRPERRLAAVVSASRDGGLLSGVLENFDVQPVRGSSSRRGAQAILEMTTWAAKGLDLAITPDGPRGPRYKVQDGVAALAQLTGLPIVPIVYEIRWKKCLRSWDRFQIPLPGSRCIVQAGKLVRVPPDLDEAQRDTYRQQIEQEMLAITVD